MDRKKGTMDHTLLILVVILIVFGLTVLLSTSAYNGQVKFSDPASYFKKQFFATILGLVAMYMVRKWITMSWKNGQGRHIFCPWSFPLWCFLWEPRSTAPGDG